MSPGASDRVTTGPVGLRRFLAEHDADVRPLDAAGFRGWIGAHLDRWSRDEVFVLRSRLRDLRRAHPGIRSLERELEQAAAADRRSAAHARLSALEKGIRDTARAIAGLRATLTASSAPDPGRRAKLAAFEATNRAQRAEYHALARGSPERRALRRVRTALHSQRTQAGLAQLEAGLARALSRQGRRRGDTGRTFEHWALELARHRMAPDVLESTRTDPAQYSLLTGVTLGAARTEFDLMLLRRTGGGQPVEVLAVAEAKANVNDLAHGYTTRLENLAWLAGDRSGYEPADYRTARDPSGHFEATAIHRQAGEEFVFSTESFAAFRAGAAARTARLWLVTRTGTMWGLSSAALARVAHRVATADDACLEDLRAWCRSLAGTVEAPDVVRRYAAEAGAARRLLILDRPPA